MAILATLREMMKESCVNLTALLFDAGWGFGSIGALMNHGVILSNTYFYGFIPPEWLMNIYQFLL